MNKVAQIVSDASLEQPVSEHEPPASLASNMAVGIAPAAETWKPAPFNRLVTGLEASEDPSKPKDVYHSLSGQGPWQPISGQAQFSLIYTTSDAKPDISNDQDVVDHERLLDSGTLGLVNKGKEGAGSVCRAVEFAPTQHDEMVPYMHRTQSVDYGIVVKGQMELLLPGQPPRLMSVGDVCVQRGTSHAWRNASTTEPARIIFILLASEKIKVNGYEIEEDLPSHAGHSAAIMNAKRV